MIANDYLDSVQKQFEYYKMLGDKTFSQVPDEKLFWQYNEDSNSITTIVKHLLGNRYTDWSVSSYRKCTDLQRRCFLHEPLEFYGTHHLTLLWDLKPVRALCLRFLQTRF
jgi:hypothetical protein